MNINPIGNNFNTNPGSSLPEAFQNVLTSMSKDENLKQFNTGSSPTLLTQFTNALSNSFYQYLTTAKLPSLQDWVDQGNLSAVAASLMSNQSHAQGLFDCFHMIDIAVSNDIVADNCGLKYSESLQQVQEGFEDFKNKGAIYYLNFLSGLAAFLYALKDPTQ